MREIFFFRHYLTELQDPNIAAIFKRHGARGYGLYWHILERLYDSSSRTLPFDKRLIEELAKATKMRKRKVRTIVLDMVALKLVTIKGNYLSSSRVDAEIKEVYESRKRNRARSS